MTATEQLNALLPTSWPTLVFVLSRMTGLTLAAPLWSMGDLPRAGRAAVVVVISLLLVPLVPRVELPEVVIGLPLALAWEVGIGAGIGLCAAVVVQGATLAGETLGIQMGLSLGPVVAPMPELAVPGVGQVKSVLALLLYVGGNGHLILLSGLADSFQSLPPGGGGAPEALLPLVHRLLETLFTTALHAAGPALVALLVIDVAVSVTSRAVPQLPAMLVLFPVTIAIGLFMIGISIGGVAGALQREFALLAERALEFVELVSSGAPHGQ